MVRRKDTTPKAIVSDDNKEDVKPKASHEYCKLYTYNIGISKQKVSAYTHKYKKR
jgi:hypothetical protein